MTVKTGRHLWGRLVSNSSAPGAQEDLGLVGRHAVGLLVVARLARLLRHAPLAGGRLVQHLYGTLARLAHDHTRVLPPINTKLQTLLIKL